MVGVGLHGGASRPYAIACAVIAISAFGCGRVAFSPLDEGRGDAGPPGVDALGGTPDDVGRVTVTFGEDMSAMVRGVTRDTALSMAAGADLNFGGADNLRIEADNFETALIAFDITALPMSATVVVAELTLWVEVPAVASIAVRPVLEDWLEGDSDGATGVASYNDRLAGVPWLRPGAGFPESAGAVIATFSPDAVGAYTFAFDESLVQSWRASPAQNFGLLLSSSSNSTVRLVSSEGADGQRPRLTIMYRP